MNASFLRNIIAAVTFILAAAMATSPLHAASDEEAHALGSFNNRPLVGSRLIKAEEWLPTTTFNGLPLSTNFIYGSFFDEDGTLYIAVRELMPKSTTGLMIFRPKEGESGLWADFESAFSSWRGGTHEFLKGGVMHWDSLDKIILGGDPSFQVTHDGTNTSWFEKGIIDVKGELRGAGTQFWDPVNNMAYSLNMHRVGGTLYGKKVEGWVGVDQQWLKAGEHYADSTNAKGGNMLLWASVANEYEDGSWETGTIMLGFKDYNFLYLTKSNGEVIRSTAATVEKMEQQENGWPSYARVSFIDDVTGKLRVWEWRAVPGTYLADHMKLAPNYGDYRGGQGVFQEVGDRRKVKYNFGWPDFYDDGRAAAFRKDGPVKGWGQHKH